MENNKHLSIEFWMQLRQGISYGIALSNANVEQLDLATDNAFRAVLRELYGYGVEQCDEAIKAIADKITEQSKEEMF